MSYTGYGNGLMRVKREFIGADYVIGIIAELGMNEMDEVGNIGAWSDINLMYIDESLAIIAPFLEAGSYMEISCHEFDNLVMYWIDENGNAQQCEGEVTYPEHEEWITEQILRGRETNGIDNK